LDDHAAAALVADLVGLDLLGLEVAHLAFGRCQPLDETAVEVLHCLVPTLPPRLDPIEVVLHPGRVLVIEDIPETLDQELDDDFTRLARYELAFLLDGVLAVLDRADDLRVGAGPADPLLLEGLDKARLVVPRRWLREMLLRQELLQL